MDNFPIHHDFQLYLYINFVPSISAFSSTTFLFLFPNIHFSFPTFTLSCLLETFLSSYLRLVFLLFTKEKPMNRTERWTNLFHERRQLNTIRDVKYSQHITLKQINNVRMKGWRRDNDNDNNDPLNTTTKRKKRVISRNSITDEIEQMNTQPFKRPKKVHWRRKLL